MNKKIVGIFAGKKIIVMGLGLLGGALNDAIFLAEHGAKLLITDLKSSTALRPSLNKLRTYKNIKYVLGRHRLKDFRNVNMVLQPGNVPLNSPYLAEARKNKIPIFVSESLFAKYAEEVVLVGVTGTRGKSTVAQLIYEILKLNYDLGLNQSAKGRLVGRKGLFGKPFLAGNVKNVSTLTLLDRVKDGDIVVMELDSWALHGMGDNKQSPEIAVLTNFMLDHQNFYKSMAAYFADKANIYRWQKPGDTLIVGATVTRKIRANRPRGKLISVRVRDFPTGWKTKLLGEHNRFNAALAITAARTLKVPEAVIKKVVANFAGVPGRLELVREVRGVKYYNDTTATTPDGTLAAFVALAGKIKARKIIWLGGGTDKELEFSKLAKEANRTAKAVILFAGTATDKILKQLRITNYELGIETPGRSFKVTIVNSMKAAIEFAKKYAKEGDIVLLSPGAASFGVFKNEFDRGEQFVKGVKKIK